MDFQLTEEHLLIKQTVRDFAEKEIAPRAEDIDVNRPVSRRHFQAHGRTRASWGSRLRRPMAVQAATISAC